MDRRQIFSVGIALGIPLGAQAGRVADATPATVVVQNVLYWILGIAGVIAIIMGVIAGAMYVVAIGSSEKAAKAKRAIGMVIGGAIMIWGVLVLLKTIAQFINGTIPLS